LLTSKIKLRMTRHHPLSKACLLAITAAVTLVCAPVRADGIEPLSAILNTPGSAGLGMAAKATASPYAGGGTRYDLMPLYLYEGERLFLRANRAGIKLFNQGRGQDGQRIDLFVEHRLEGYPSDRLPSSLAGMEKRDSGINLGLAYRQRQSWGTLRAELMRDVGSASRGIEARLGYGYEWRSGPWSLRPDLSLSWRDAKLNDYYYGVRANEARSGRAAYAPGSGMQSQLGLYGSYDASQRWRLLAGVSATVLGTSVKNSPIVEKRILPALYIGAAYDFGSPQKQRREGAEDTSPTYVKLMYGKATEDGCHLARIITARCLGTAKINATNIAGVQLGKPFVQGLNGWPLDFAGYVGLTYHDERGLQANGAQLDVFMKAIYYGFPWRERVKTRLGLGVGLSAAQRVPYTEVASQAGKTTSRLLNYLDPTIDVSVGDLFGVRSMKDTFVGFGVSHRSGIFGASRLLGNVSGGSNYIYTYLETAF
jgi:outer membrane protein